MTTTTQSIFSITGATPVIPVNCVGVAGKGVALEWRTLDPLAYERYADMCKRSLLYPGDVVPVTGDMYWLLAATKNEWRLPSRIEWVEMCIRRIAAYAMMNPRPLAVPMLGCGSGGLDRRPVFEHMHHPFSSIDTITVSTL